MRSNRFRLRRNGDCPQCGCTLHVEEWAEFHPYGSTVAEEDHYEVECQSHECDFYRTGTGKWIED